MADIVIFIYTILLLAISTFVLVLVIKKAKLNQIAPLLFLGLFVANYINFLIAQGVITALLEK